MSPESCLGLLHMVDHWKLMLAQMHGEPLPPLPDLHGRIVKAPEIPDPATDAAHQDADLQAAAVWRALASDTEGGTHD